MKKNNFKFTILVILLVVLSSFVTFAAGEWVQDGDKWKYKTNKLGYLSERWSEIPMGSGKVYYFDYFEHMVTGFNVIKDELYIYNDDGTAKTDGVLIGEQVYPTDGKGKVLNLPIGFDLSLYPKAASSTEYGAAPTSLLGQANLASQAYQEMGTDILAPTATANQQ